MTKLIVVIASALLMATLTADCKADELDRFAGRLNRHRVLHHSFANRAGDKVVYRSSGKASQAAAIQSWQNSPPHAALLPSVTRIVCRGRVCVGR